MRKIYTNSSVKKIINYRSLQVFLFENYKNIYVNTVVNVNYDNYRMSLYLISDYIYEFRMCMYLNSKQYIDCKRYLSIEKRIK